MRFIVELFIIWMEQQNAGWQAIDSSQSDDRRPSDGQQSTFTAVIHIPPSKEYLINMHYFHAHRLYNHSPHCRHVKISFKFVYFLRTVQENKACSLSLTDVSLATILDCCYYSDSIILSSEALIYVSLCFLICDNASSQNSESCWWVYTVRIDWHSAFITCDWRELCCIVFCVIIRTWNVLIAVLTFLLIV